MSRRDTIIIAVLVNAGLLMILFATALKSDDKKKEKQVSVTQLAQVPATKVIPPVPEEVVVNQYAMAGVPTLVTEEIPFEQLQIPEEKPVEPKPAPMRSNSDVYCVNVTVKKGDFLEKIAKANNTTVSAIMTENDLASTQLKVGQVLRVPVRQKPPEQQSSPAPSAAEEYYVVKDGDNPWLIASKNHVSLTELLRINNLDEQKARRLRPGDRLKIR